METIQREKRKSKYLKKYYYGLYTSSPHNIQDIGVKNLSHTEVTFPCWKVTLVLSTQRRAHVGHKFINVTCKYSLSFPSVLPMEENGRIKNSYFLKTNAKWNKPVRKEQINLYAVPRAVKLTEAERTMAATRSWGRGIGGYCVMGTEFYFGNMKKTSGEDCTIMLM